MKRWVLVFLADERYIDKAFGSIREARREGGWINSIVLMVPASILTEAQHQSRARELGVQFMVIPHRNVDKVLGLWKANHQHPKSSYVAQRPYIYNKFYLMDVRLKQWDVVFYMDSGVTVQSSLQRFVQSCEPDHCCFYGHSDAYPTYERTLATQFSPELFTEENRAEFLEKYHKQLRGDYFQTTLFIYDTGLIQSDSVQTLFDLNDKFTSYGDQGIFNLYIGARWKQITLRDEVGWLYDYLVRDGQSRGEYAVLKI